MQQAKQLDSVTILIDSSQFDSYWNPAVGSVANANARYASTDERTIATKHMLEPFSHLKGVGHFEIEDAYKDRVLAKDEYYRALEGQMMCSK